MQLLFAFDDGAATFADIHYRLLIRFGRQGPWRLLDPVSQLVLGIIGGRTRGTVSLLVLEALVQRFGSWEAVRDAAYHDVQREIFRVTFAENKARHLQAALRQLTALRGSLELEFLAAWPVDAALEWLERLPGVGRKASAATLNFSSLRMKALVIDSHHLRVMTRLGLIGAKATTMDAYLSIVPRLPSRWIAADIDEHHQLVKSLGQTICRHDTPACADCPLQDLCSFKKRSARVCWDPRIDVHKAR
ncbi:endonuclease III [Pelagibius sp. Alg239-R121]|uniref:endonuclease III domain-containing protein n=1 Tax=Pelagibius sp. Alg239-R121 TaxID=2993448 RepID=UPI0024A6C238|nr:hypothetical protein [Pelagibius sp. Alg239-R121]